MVRVHPHRLKLRDAIWNTVEKAAFGSRTLNCSELAGQLERKYPHCGMTVREIENELIKQIGVAGGTAQIGVESDLIEMPSQRI